jgi:hypothetical protein
LDYKRLELTDEWDPRGVLFFAKGFEEAYDEGKVILSTSKKTDLPFSCTVGVPAARRAYFLAI